jgi:hypothetical protein
MTPPAAGEIHCPDLDETFCLDYLAGDGVTCQLCGKVNSTPQNARRHVRFVHLGESEAVSCAVCGKMFGRKQVLLRHQRTQHAALL